MRVNTKYGTGILLGLDALHNEIGFKVLIDDECLRLEDEVIKIERSIYNCLWIEVITEDNKKVLFHNGAFNVKK